MHPATKSDDHQLPIPKRQFNWYIGFWHLIYLGSLLWVSLLVINDWWKMTLSGNKTVVLLGLITLQALLYLRLIWFNPNWQKRWPLPARDLWLYFGGSLFCWVLEWQLEPGFFWFVLSYLGQMFGILPPVAALAGTTTLYLLIQAKINDWDFSNWSSGEIVGQLTSWLSLVVIYFFITYLIRTSNERGRLVRQLQETQAQLALAREKELELAALRERERLARDLHDSLGHALVTMSVQLEAIQRLYRVDPQRGSTHIDELKTLVRRSMDDLRRSLAGLRTPGLGDRQLSEALREHCIETSQRTGLEIRCQIADGADQLSPAIAEAIWRIVHESLANVEKHANARIAHVQLVIDPKSVHLSIEDDGAGLPEGAENVPGHYGLRGLRERAEGLGGIVTLSTTVNRGAKIEVALPLV